MSPPFGIKLYNFLPLPRLRGYIYLHGMGAGGGRGWVSQNYPNQQARPEGGYHNISPPGWQERGIPPRLRKPSPKTPVSERTERIGGFPAPGRAAPHLTSGGEKSIIKRGGAPHSEKRGTHL